MALVDFHYQRNSNTSLWYSYFFMHVNMLVSTNKYSGFNQCNLPSVDVLDLVAERKQKQFIMSKYGNTMLKIGMYYTCMYM